MKILYTAHGIATGGREGRGAAVLCRLFRLLHRRPRVVAARDKRMVPDDTQVSAEVGIGPRDDGTGFGITVALRVHIPGLERNEAEALVQKADIVCPYSHATKGNIQKAIEIV